MAAHLAPTRRVALAAAAALALAGLAACGDDDDEPTGGTTATTSAGDDGGSAPDDYGGAGGDDGGQAADDTVVAEGFQFTVPASVAAGSTVTFSNADGAPHTMTADDGVFDSGQVAAGDEGEITAPDEPGAYTFHCEIHSSMTGTLTVE